MTTAKEKRHMARVAELPCCLCGAIGVQVHHITENGRRISHFITIPACVDCHEGAQGIHGDKTMLRVMKTTELKLLAETIEAIEERGNDDNAIRAWNTRQDNGRGKRQWD